MTAIYPVPADNSISTEKIQDGAVTLAKLGDDVDLGGGTGAVDSVNGQTGDVVLTATDVGAAAASDLAAETTQRTSADSGLASAIAAKYTKPGGGIPASDLAFDPATQAELDAVAAAAGSGAAEFVPVTAFGSGFAAKPGATPGFDIVDGIALGRGVITATYGPTVSGAISGGEGTIFTLPFIAVAGGWWMVMAWDLTASVYPLSSLYGTTDMLFGGWDYNTPPYTPADGAAIEIYLNGLNVAVAP